MLKYLIFLTSGEVSDSTAAQTISIIENAQEALELEFKLISSSFRTIEIIFSSANIFYRTTEIRNNTGVKGCSDRTQS